MIDVDTTPKRVLIVDDNVDLAENLREILEEESLEVKVANAGPNALAQLRGERFDLVLTDMRMPGLSGVEVLSAVREEFPGVPVAVMTAYSSDRMLDEARENGAISVILKPIPLDQLLGLVKLATEPKQVVLLVEDEPGLRVDLTEALAAGRVLTFACADIHQARRCLDGLSPDVLIIDRRLPDGDGVAFAESLPSGPAGVRPPVLLISGAHCETSEINHLSLSGPTEYLMKPIPLAVLIDRLSQLSCPRS